MKFEFIGKYIKIIEINKKYIFFEGNLQLNENDQIVIFSYNLNSDKVCQFLLYQTKTLKNELIEKDKKIDELETRLEKMEK